MQCLGPFIVKFPSIVESIAANDKLSLVESLKLVIKKYILFLDSSIAVPITSKLLSVRLLKC